MPTPLDNINDGHEFQRIVAEYFRCLKSEKQDFHIADIEVDDNGVGGDDGVDITVEFFYQDAIDRHSRKWIVECKCWDRNLGPDSFDTNRIHSILSANDATGFLIVCKKDITASLKRTIRGVNKNARNGEKIITWNGTQLWRMFSQSMGLIQSFFPDYYQEKFIDNASQQNFEKEINRINKKLSS